MSVLYYFIGVGSIIFGGYIVDEGPTDIQLGIGFTLILGGLCLIGIGHMTDLIKKHIKAHSMFLQSLTPKPQEPSPVPHEEISKIISKFKRKDS